MQTKIRQYSYENVAEISDLLLEYRDTLDYRNLFTSKEWLLSFLEIYKPDVNFLVRSNNNLNYFSLSVFNNELIFTGDPFNDFNCVFIKDESDLYDFGAIVKYLSQLYKKIKWYNLSELKLLKSLPNIGKVQDGITCLKITEVSEVQDYDVMISKKIKQMYEKFSNALSFNRIFGNEKQFRPLLENLLQVRQDKLLNHKREGHNLSFEDKFNEFIIKLAGSGSLGENLFIDYCIDKNNGEIVASSLNFIKDKKIICYLRAHAQSENHTSYGLILDYWSNRKNFGDGVKIIDFTRGDESYKYRLGAKEYKLKNFVTI